MNMLRKKPLWLIRSVAWLPNSRIVMRRHIIATKEITSRAHNMVKNGILFFLIATKATIGCAENEAQVHVAYYQNYNKSSNSLGFKLTQEILPSQAKKGEYLWRATFDKQDRLIVLETIVPPMCVESRQKFVYEKSSTNLLRREREKVSECESVLTKNRK